MAHDTNIVVPARNGIAGYTQCSKCHLFSFLFEFEPKCTPKKVKVAK